MVLLGYDKCVARQQGNIQLHALTPEDGFIVERKPVVLPVLRAENIDFLPLGVIGKAARFAERLQHRHTIRVRDRAFLFNRTDYIDFLAVDLNSLLYQLEMTIARGCEAARRADCHRRMLAQARARQAAMLQFMWDGRLNAFVDYDWRKELRSRHLTAATAYPLFAGIATPAEAERVAGTIRSMFLMKHGMATTLAETGEQWDAPNGWAPLQWIAISGLREYGQHELAQEIATRWVTENARVYCRTGKLVEKYNVRDAGAGAGGEYPVQDGFGWTNGVLVRLLAIYPQLAQEKYEFNGAECRAEAASELGDEPLADFFAHRGRFQVSDLVAQQFPVPGPVRRGVDRLQFPVCLVEPRDGRD